MGATSWTEMTGTETPYTKGLPGAVTPSHSLIAMAIPVSAGSSFADASVSYTEMSISATPSTEMSVAASAWTKISL